MTGQINNLMRSDIINSGKVSNYFCLFMYYLFSLFKLLYWRERKTSKTQSGLLTLPFFHGISKHSDCSITNHIVLVTSDPSDPVFNDVPSNSQSCFCLHCCWWCVEKVFQFGANSTKFQLYFFQTVRLWSKQVLSASHISKIECLTRMHDASRWMMKHIGPVLSDSWKLVLSFSIHSSSSPFSQHAPESTPFSNLSFFHSSIHLLNPQEPVFSSTYSPPISLGQKCQYTDHHSQVRTRWASRAQASYFSAPFKVAGVSRCMGVEGCHFWSSEE